MEVNEIENGLKDRDGAQIMPQKLEHGMKTKQSQTQLVEEDPISVAVGEYGRWQLLMTFLLALFSFPCTFHIFAPTFTGAASPYWCARPPNLLALPEEEWRNRSQPNGACWILDVDWSAVDLETIHAMQPATNGSVVACSRWEYDTIHVGTTIFNEWNLVCDRSYIVTLSEMIFLVGVGIGGVIGGLISDRYGRKNTLMASCFFQTLFGILSAFCDSYELFMLLKFVMGLCSVSMVFSGFVLSVELVGGKWVTIAGVCNFFPLPISYILVSAIAMILPNWRHLQLAISIPSIFLLGLWWVLPESPRWLLSSGRIKETKIILQQIAKFNNRTLPDSLDAMLMSTQSKNVENEMSPGLSHLFKSPFGKRTVCLFIVWFTMTLSYYGLVLNMANFGSDLHKTSIISGIVEIPAVVLCIPLLLKAGRRFPVFISMGLCGAACLGSVFVKELIERQWAMTAMVMMGKFSISATNIMMPTYTAELYPTLIRNLGVGSSQVAAGFALSCTPYLWTLSSISHSMPMATIGVLGILGGTCVLLLPDTGATVKHCETPIPVNGNEPSRSTGARGSE